MAPARTEPQVGEWTEHSGWIAIAAARCIHSRAIDNVQRTYTLEELKSIAEREGYSAISVHSSGRTVLMRFSIQLTLGCQQATGHTLYIRRLPPIAAASPVREVMELPHEEVSPPLVGEREEVVPAPENEVAPESEAAPEPAEERPSMLSRLTSWRAPLEPEEDTPAAPAREEAGSATQICAPEAAEARAKSAAAAADEESGAAEKSGADWRPAYALALAAALVVCVMQLLALMPHRHWSSVIFEFDYRFENTHWDVAYDLWGWDAVKTYGPTGTPSLPYEKESEGSFGVDCASEDRNDPGGLGKAACLARDAARAGTIICLALAFMVSGALAKWFRNPALTHRGKSRWWWLKATGGALAVGGAVALGTALNYRAAHEKALSSGGRDDCVYCIAVGADDGCGFNECVDCSECGVVGCSQGCVNAMVGGALALFAGCAMAVYARCCYDCAGSCCPACCHPNRAPDGRYRITKSSGI